MTRLGIIEMESTIRRYWQNDTDKSIVMGFDTFKNAQDTKDISMLRCEH